MQRRVKLRKKEDKRLRGIDGTGQYASFLLMHNNSVVILRPVLVRFYRTGEETTFKRHRSRFFIDKEQKPLLLNWETINSRTYKLTHTSTVVRARGEGLTTIPCWGFRSIKAQGNNDQLCQNQWHGIRRRINGQPLKVSTSWSKSPSQNFHYHPPPLHPSRVNRIASKNIQISTKLPICNFELKLGPGQSPSFTWAETVQLYRLMWSSAFDPIQFDWFCLARLGRSSRLASHE